MLSSGASQRWPQWPSYQLSCDYAAHNTCFLMKRAGCDGHGLDTHHNSSYLSLLATGTPAPYLLLQHFSQQRFRYQKCCIPSCHCLPPGGLTVQFHPRLSHDETLITTSCHTSIRIFMSGMSTKAYFGGQLCERRAQYPLSPVGLPSGYNQASSLPKPARLFCRPLSAYPFFLFAATEALLLPINLGNR